MPEINLILRDGQNVPMPELRLYLAQEEAKLAQANLALATGTVAALIGDRVYATQAALYADLVPADNLFALVYADTDPLKNGLYQKDGATTTGDWDGPFDLFSSAAEALVQTLVDDAEAAVLAAETAKDAAEAAQEASEDARDAALNHAASASGSAVSAAEDADRAENAVDTVAAAALAANVKPECAACATTNITRSGIQNIDGIPGEADQRVFIAIPSGSVHNGPWLQKAGAWVRPTDFDTSAEVVNGTTVFVSGGANGGTYVLETANPITLGTTPLVWRRVNGGLRSTALEVQHSALSEAGGSTKRLFDVIPPSGMINSAGTDDAVPVRFAVQIARFTSGPAPYTSYQNTVAGFGTNMNDNFTAANTSSGKGSATFRIESGFIQPDGIATGFAAEFHHSIFTLNGVELRPISVYAPFTDAEYVTGSIVSTKSARIIMQDGNARDRFQFDFRSSGNRVSINGDGVSLGHPTLDFDTNNRTTLRQRNAAGNAFLPLPFINSDNNIQMQDSPVYIVAPVGTTPLGSGANRASLSLNVTSPVAGASAVKVQGFSGVTGTFDAFRFEMPVSSRLGCQIYNSGAGQGVFEIQSLNGSGNDGILAFSNVGAGGQSWTIGRDNSDGNKLKIESSYLTVGTSAALFLEFDATAGISRFTKPARLPSYTVSGLPSASTVGAGSLAYVTDLNSTTAGSTAAGGGSNNGTVVSDGTAWRIMAAWA